MSIDISVPGGNPNKPGFFVQRSASGLSISAGALASTNTMFGAMNDEGGLSVSAWPVSLGETEFNYVPNPRFHVGTASWPDTSLGLPSYFWTYNTDALERVTSVPFGDLPEGADACCRLSPSYASPMAAVVISDLHVLVGTYLDLTFMMAASTFGAPPEPCAAQPSAWIRFYDDDMIDVDSPGHGITNYPSGGWPMLGWTFPLDTWYTFTDSAYVPEGATRAILYLMCQPTSNADGEGFLALVRVGGTEYKDGDSPGWMWDGTPHNSSSRGTP